jgi:co-chaperonin GroES (HSP10)
MAEQDVQIPVVEAPTALEAAERRSLERVEAIRKSGEELAARRAEELEKLKGFVPVSADPSFTRRVVVQVAKRQRSEGGIELPENMKVKPVVGLVVGLSPGPGPLQVGERVLFMRFAGVDVELPNGEVLEEHKVLRENECFGHWPAHVHVWTANLDGTSACACGLVSRPISRTFHNLESE